MVDVAADGTSVAGGSGVEGAGVRVEAVAACGTCSVMGS